MQDADYTAVPLVWKGAELRTMGDTMDALLACKTREEAQDFMATYKAVNEHARENVGYALVYYVDGQRLRELQEWCAALHPIFGATVPSAAEAFEAGRR